MYLCIREFGKLNSSYYGMMIWVHLSSWSDRSPRGDRPVPHLPAGPGAPVLAVGLGGRRTGPGPRGAPDRLPDPAAGRAAAQQVPAGEVRPQEGLKQDAPPLLPDGHAQEGGQDLHGEEAAADAGGQDLGHPVREPGTPIHVVGIDDPTMLCLSKREREREKARMSALLYTYGTYVNILYIFSLQKTEK